MRLHTVSLCTHNGHIPVADEQQSRVVSNLVGTILDTYPSFNVLDLHSILTLQLFEGTLGAWLTKVNDTVCAVNEDMHVHIIDAHKRIN